MWIQNKDMELNSSPSDQEHTFHVIAIDQASALEKMWAFAASDKLDAAIARIEMNQTIEEPESGLAVILFAKFARWAAFAISDVFVAYDLWLIVLWLWCSWCRFLNTPRSATNTLRIQDSHSASGFWTVCRAASEQTLKMHRGFMSGLKRILRMDLILILFAKNADLGLWCEKRDWFVAGQWIGICFGRGGFHRMSIKRFD